MFGSGGRAAIAISNLAPSLELFTYCAPEHIAEAKSLTGRFGIELTYRESIVGFVFSYFHPLSDPYLEPDPSRYHSLPPLQVTGSSVLRFGLLEGSAVVTAERAVFDPQMSPAGASFWENGSQAGELALVLNESELKAMTGRDALVDAIGAVLEKETASVVVVKRGPRGAAIFGREINFAEVPAYRSQHVFKIGSGDVFSSVFAYYWAEERRAPIEAASLASCATASYCNSRKLPLSFSDLSPLFQPASGIPRRVGILTRAVSLEGTWLVEEFTWSLEQLGATVVRSELFADVENCDAILVITSGASKLVFDSALQAVRRPIPLVLFAQEGLVGDWASFEAFGAIKTAEFTSAVYHVVWASMRAADEISTSR
jgi:hypothetical protein